MSKKYVNGVLLDLTAEEQKIRDAEVQDDGSPVKPIDLIVAKQRNGPTGIIELMFHPSITRFENAAKEI